MNTSEANKIISDFIEKEKEEINALKRKRNEELLDRLKLFSIEKEYAPEDYKPPYGYYSSSKYPKSEVFGDTKRYYREVKVYPDISDETYNELINTLQEKEVLTPKPPVIEKKEEKKPLSFSITSRYSDDDGIAATFMKVIAWILWIGGLILSIVISRNEVPYSSYRTETVFNWTTFTTVFSSYALLGGFAMCMSELFENISTIKNQLLSYEVKENL